MQGAEGEAGLALVGFDGYGAALTSVHFSSCYSPHDWHLSCFGLLILFLFFSVVLFLFLHCAPDVVFLSVAHLAPRRSSTPVRG